jgi:uncharacterized protein
MEEQFTNRLIGEKSPYLLQHAHNPVNWYPWGEEAFRASQEQDKPIFLSIGYATCHWCHVMEEESFCDKDVAQAINEAFIPVKVDREELPEVDTLYMEFAQAMVMGSAGWPLNLLLTPELKPFFAATYLPKHTARGLIGVVELAQKIGTLWNSSEKERVIEQSEKIYEVLKTHIHTQGTELPLEEVIHAAAELLFKVADPIYGGLKGAPKFPIGYQSLFLLHYFLRTQDSRALFLVEKTLEMMHRGGIYDHLGGGFHRYAVDEAWKIPHFEKMLYDNAILAIGYLEAWRVTGRDLYQVVCEEILQYILRDMTRSDGGFYSAEDADSAGVEGLFYTWTREEVINALGKEEGELFCNFYSVEQEGELEGRSVLYMEQSIDEFCTSHGLSHEKLEKMLTKNKKLLFKLRDGRVHPLKDDKVITSWNGLMIQALAYAGFSLKKKEYQDAAMKAARFIKNTLWDTKEQVLYRRFRDGEAKYRGGLDDYAFLIGGLLSLFETGCGVEWLEWAIELTKILERDFKVPEGAFYQTDGQDTSLLIRKCHYSDGAEPSGNAMHAENLLRLYQITGEVSYLEQAEDIAKAAKRYIEAYPLGYCYHLKALQRYYDKKKATIIISYNQEHEWKEEILDTLSHKVLPHYSLIFRSPHDTLEKVLPHTVKMHPASEKTTVLICYEGACQKPLSEKEEIIRAITQL